MSAAEHLTLVPPPPPDERPRIRLSRELHRTLEDVDCHLGQADPGLFQRANELVIVVGARAKEGRMQLAEGTPILRSATPAAIKPRMTRHLIFEKAAPPSKIAILMAKQQGELPAVVWAPCTPTPDVIASFLALGEWDYVRPIVGVTQTPMLRDDGTVLQTRGWDACSRYLYLPNADFPIVEQAPSQQSAIDALADLQDVFCDFPYVDPSHALVPIAALLTVFARAAIDGPTPAFIFDASMPGSGKTLQADVVHGLALGAGGTHTNWPEKEDDQEKLLGSVASIAAPILILDNVKGTLGGGAIEGVLTLTKKAFRILGRNDTMSVLPWLAVTMITGNNFQVGDDMVRRSLLARLESPLENPTKRTGFKHALGNLSAWLAQHRTRLVHAALTVLRAYTAHGRPETGVGVLASYDAWSAIVPQAIAFAGGANVLGAALDPIVSASPDVGAAAAVVAHLPGLLRRCELGTLAPVKRILGACYPAPKRGELPDGNDELREAIETLVPARGGAAPDARALGLAFRKFKDRWFGNHRLVCRPGHAKTQLWGVETRI